jgi:hypothetical protein
MGRPLSVRSLGHVFRQLYTKMLRYF